MRLGDMKRIILTSAICLACLFLNAQSYDTAFGVRLGTDWGFTLNQRVAKKTTIEGIIQSSLASKRDEVLVTGMVRQHFPMASRRLNVYSGGGLHKGWLNSSEFDDPFGVTLVAGIEFTIARVNLSYDFKPAINISGGDKTFYTQTGISARYVLVTSKNSNKRRRQRQRDKRKKQREKEGKKFNWKFWEKEPNG